MHTNLEISPLSTAAICSVVYDKVLQFADSNAVLEKSIRLHGRGYLQSACSLSLDLSGPFSLIGCHSAVVNWGRFVTKVTDGGAVDDYQTSNFVLFVFNAKRLKVFCVNRCRQVQTRYEKSNI